MVLQLGSVVLTLVLLSAIQSVCFTQNTYHIKPTSDTPCPAEPCLTLSEYAQGHPLTSNTTFIFLPGDHSLDRDITVTNVTRFVMLGDSTFSPNVKSRIACKGQEMLTFHNISLLQIHFLQISSCGSGTVPALSLISVSQVEILGSVFQDNGKGSLLVVQNMLNCSGTNFSSGLGTGLKLYNSHAELHNVVFSNNSGGGINSTNSTLTLVGTNAFTNNTADFGGGILAIESSVYITGNTSFLDNSVLTSGGGVYLERSNLSCNGTMVFARNIVSTSDFSTRVAGAGGGISVLDSEIHLEGNSTFVDNVAMYGGGLMSLNSTVTLIGGSSFVNNVADRGGGLVSLNSIVTFRVGSSFVNNVADRGGGLLSLNSTVTLIGGSSFVNNVADTGGGFVSLNSVVTLRGGSSFVNNVADRGGGLVSLNSIIILIGSSNFVNNVADTGGGLESWKSTVTVRGHSSFVNNSATRYGGGILATTGSDLTLNGTTTFTRNIAQEGAGINVQESSIRCTEHTSFVNNMAKYNGGGLTSLNSNVTLTGGSSFVNNSATVLGGGVFATEGSDLTLNGGNTFTHNIAQQGSGMNVQSSSFSCTGYTGFMNNMASDGGGLLSSNSTVTLRGGSSFVNNSATRYGGGIFATTGSHLTLNGGITFRYNFAWQGAGMNVQESRISCTGNTSFMNNVADVGGGPLSLNSIITLRGSNTFMNNMALSDGGGLESVNGIVTLRGDSSFVNNVADRGGGLVSRNSTIILIGSSNFVNNVADTGGGLESLNSIVTLRGGSSFVNNVADRGGGLVSWNSTIILIGSSNFVNNMASDGGGGLVSVNSSVTLRGGSSFVNNVADRGGGLVSWKSTIILIGSSNFVNNMASNGGGGLVSVNSSVTLRGGSSFVNNSATRFGGGIFATEGSDLTLTGSIIFTYNLAQQGAGMNVQESSISYTGNTSFMNNVASEGGGLLLFNSTVTMKENSSFVNNSADAFGGGIAVANGTDLNMYGRITFAQNRADLLGGGMFVSDSNIGVYNNLAGDNGGYDSFSRCTFTQNTAIYGGGAFLVNSNASFTGKTDFHNNLAVYGGGIHGSRANLEVSEEVSFTENSATNGGGISLAGGSQCFLSSNATVYFEGNHAEQYGGAMFVTDEPFLYCTRDQPAYILALTREHCFFQALDLPNTTALFILENNTAEKAGSTLYGGMVDSCILNPVKYNPGEVFDELFNIIRNNNTSEELIISSDPFHVCPCYDGLPNCNQSDVTVTAYPGATFSVSLVAVGQRNGLVPSIIQSSFDESGASLGNLQHAQSANNTCTPLYYTVSSTSPLVAMTLLADGPCLDLGESLHVHIHLKPCPIGFELSESSKQCSCEHRLRKYTNSCDIDDLTIDVDGSAWVGLTRTADGIILHPHCPFDYCKSHSVRFSLNETDLQCNYDRRGLLCGGCQPGLSLALGSSHCLQCSNTHLSLLVVFALAGIALVVLLLLCKLTVALGTINGLILYANIIAVNQSVFFPSGDTNNIVLDILRLFISWLNLDLGIETCFYDGMDAYARTWLQFMFPVYIWVLVFTVIILCYYKTWAVRMFGRNPVAVLATLFLLSYAKLLRTIITALSFTFPEYPDGSEVAVWLYDGNIQYLKGKHIPLFLVSMTVLLLLFLPYTLVLLFGQWMQAHSNMRLFSWINDHRVKAFLDAYHGPFRKEHRYWSGLLLVFRSCLFLLFAFNALGNPNVNLLAIIICSAVLTLLTVFTGRIYVNWYLQGLEASFVMNCLVFAAATLYFRSANGNQAALTYTSVGIALVTFTGMISYHVTIQLKDSCVWRDIIHPKLQRHRRQWVAVPLEDPVADGDPDSVPSHPPTRTFINLRETLLEDSVPDVDGHTVAEPERYIVQRRAQPTQTVVNLQELIREDPANNVLPMIELH